MSDFRVSRREFVAAAAAGGSAMILQTASGLRMKPPDGVAVGALFQPFYAMPEVNSCRMYFNRDKLPYILW